MSKQYRAQPAGGLDRWLPRLGLTACLLLGGCSTLDYYSQASRGHLQLMQQREPIEQLLADPSQDALLRQRLGLALQARNFASNQLELPDNQSYRLYADIQRPVLLWNVFVTPEFSLEAELQCFPVAGCVAYRGYFDLNDARGAAALAQQAGMDSWVGAVEAYSTLGWFDDPLLSSMLQRDDQQLAAVIFHELAHQQLYLADDTTFNESFASFVEQQGLQQWLASRDEAALAPQQACRRQQFTALVLDSRARLQALYASQLPTAQMRQAKQAEFIRMRNEYRQLRDHHWGGDSRYDQWMEGPLNNAKLLPFGLYEQWLPAFARLYEQSGKNWTAFYLQAKQLASLAPAERQQHLQKLAEEAGAGSLAELVCDTGRG
ncbi:Predicted aminopeptidase [Pseudomonas pohangensis]|uniref:Predicted aminopeptidase n=1 Tax=Pseudomonas pohangensis TaxID=364197 RepID=A0A1H2HZR2_9PSED|nr:aminopeptidase [Pseudomonas pohangensis]SDU37259.1 Predicted aminopeptidase [Pseudomonas pohangensis]